MKVQMSILVSGKVWQFRFDIRIRVCNVSLFLLQTFTLLFFSVMLNFHSLFHFICLQHYYSLLFLFFLNSGLSKRLHLVYQSLDNSAKLMLKLRKNTHTWECCHVSKILYFFNTLHI